MGTSHVQRRRGMTAAVAVFCLWAASPVGAAAYPPERSEAFRVPRATKAVRPAPAATGTLRLDYDDFEVTLLSEKGKRSLSGKNGRAVLPAGSYTLLAWTVRARGADGRVWQARGGMGIDDVVIRPGRTTRLTLASPLKARWASVSGSNPALMELRFFGTSGEECLGVGVGEKSPPPPRFEVRDAAGAVVYAGDVRFCCKFRGAALWLRDGTEGTPAGAAGRFSAHVAADWGPFRVVMEAPLRFDVAAVTAPADAAAVGQQAPEILLPPIDGGSKVALSALRDRPVALCFFCGCGPCSEVAQGLARMSGIHAVAVVSDAESFRGEALRRFRSLTGFRGSILYDRDHNAIRRYQSFTCPRVWLVDRTGRLVYTNASPRDEPGRILTGLRAALDALPARPAVAAGE